MSNKRGGARLGAGRKRGSLVLRSQELQERLLSALQDDTFDLLVATIINIALHGEKDSDRLKAAIYLLDKATPKAPDIIEHTINEGLSVQDIIGPGRYRTVSVDDEDS